MDLKQIERELDDVERNIGLLKRDFEIYFAGASKLPPLDQRDKLDKTIKRIATLQGMNYAQRFRYNSLVARFNTYADLWGKQLRLKEEGRQTSGLRTSKKFHDTNILRNDDSGARERAAKPAEDPFERVYKDYIQARERVGESTANLTFESFAKIISKQRETIVEKFHCRDVEFYVAIESGHTKLKAKPLK